jgi:hypothetical protein
LFEAFARFEQERGLPIDIIRRTNAAGEQDAINAALADCGKHDSHCHIIAIGPYLVEPN